MDQTVTDWAAPLVFVLLFAAVIITEVIWLSRGNGTSRGKAAAFVLLSDLGGFITGFFIVFAALGVIFMMVMGPAGTGSDAPEAAYWAALAAAAVLPFLVFVGLRRLLLAAFAISSGPSAWLYALVSTVLVLLIVLVPPSLVFYLLSIWK